MKLGLGLGLTYPYSSGEPSLPFSPADIPGLKLWLDASDLATIIESNQFVSEWRDKSGNGNHALQTTGSQQPITNAITINGNNVITYDGVNDALIIPHDSSIDNIFSGGGTAYSVALPLTAGENNFGRIFDKGGTTQVYIREPVGGQARYAHISGFSTTDGAFQTATTPVNLLGEGNILGTLYDNSLVVNKPVFRVNGLLSPIITEFNPSGTASSDAGSDMVIGNRIGADRTWNGDLGEVILYDRILTATEIADLENYLSNKWGTGLGFSPESIPGLKLWLDASDTATIIESGGLVSKWQDKSGNNNHALQTTGTQKPVTNLNTINGKNVITYDGVDDSLSILPDGSINDLFDGGGSVFSVVNPLTAGEGNFGRVFEKGGITVNFLREPLGGEVKYGHISSFSTTNGQFRTATTAVTLGIGNILGFLYDTSLTTNTPEFRVDGSIIATNPQSTPVGTADSDAGSNLVIGNRPGADRTWDGYFAEVIMYDHILTAEEILALEDYLFNKWGISSPFPFAFSTDFSSDFS